MDKLKIAIGSDHGGFRYKGIIEEYLKFRKKYSKKAETQFKKFMK